MPHKCMRQFEVRKEDSRAGSIKWDLGKFKKVTVSGGFDVRPMSCQATKGGLLSHVKGQIRSVKQIPGKLAKGYESCKLVRVGQRGKHGEPKLTVKQEYIFSTRAL